MVLEERGTEILLLFARRSGSRIYSALEVCLLTSPLSSAGRMYFQIDSRKGTCFLCAIMMASFLTWYSYSMVVPTANNHGYTWHFPLEQQHFRRTDHQRAIIEVGIKLVSRTSTPNAVLHVMRTESVVVSNATNKSAISDLANAETQTRSSDRARGRTSSSSALQWPHRRKT